jgi:hypothetical protein
MGKRVAIVNAGGKGVTEVMVEPGTTVADIKRHIEDGDQYLLSKPGGNFLADSEVVFPLVVDGDKLEASPRIQVGSIGGPTPFPLIKALVTRLGILGSAVRFPGEPPITVTPVDVTGQPDKKHLPARPALTIGPDTRPFWQQKGWIQDGIKYRGYYRTRFGAWEGRAMRYGKNLFTLMILDPPEQVLSGPHRLCFSSSGPKEYKIHFKQKPNDISGCILSVEKTIEESFRCYKKTNLK